MSTLQNKLANAINRMLRPLGVSLVRSATLNALTTVQSQQSDVAALAARVTALESGGHDEAIKNVISYAMRAHWRVIDLMEEIAESPQTITCPLCSHAAPIDGVEQLESQCLFFGGKLVRHRCPQCDVVFGPHKMLQLDDQMVDLEYRNLYRIYAEGDSTESIIRTFHLLASKKDGAYLDFGCGGEWSNGIAPLRQEGWNIIGFEPSAKTSSEHVVSTWAEVEQRRFDGILTHNVLEHLFDPAGTTARLARLLTAGGRLVHTTPCFEYAYEYSRFHVFFFIGRSPNVLAEKAAMRIVDWVRDGDFIACIMQR